MSHPGWTAAQLPRLDGKIIVVTGANSGIGYEAARGLAGAGAHVVLACRSEASASDAIAKIRAEHAAARMSFLPLDLSSLASVRAFADAFGKAHDRLDVLVNNAGVMALPYRKTADGFEMQLGTNHLGHFALTGLLLSRIVRAAPSRVVTVSSGAHKFGKIRFDDLQWEHGYQRWMAYGQSKLANLLFAYELERRLEARGLSVRSVACHPGYAATNLQLAAARMESSSFGEKMWRGINGLFAQPMDMGALPTLFAAGAAEVRGGDYIGPGGMLEMSGHPVKVESNARSHDVDVARRLWEVSEQLTGVRYAGALGAN
jgi:NAD(P)-dependent dehydrogenase (short-subunit alcohol dehydrogenase family)